jgi:hypothetical protein
MNIAICLSGSLRKIKKSLRSVEDISKTGNVKLFIHTWNFEKEINLQNQRVTPDEDSNTNYLLNKFNIEAVLIDKYESKEFLFEDIKKYSVKLTDHPNAFGYYPMHYSIKRANDLKKVYEIENNFIFDIVYRMRFDSEILNPEKLPINKINENVIIIPTYSSWHQADHGGINDQFAYGSSIGMDCYSNLFNSLSKLNGTYNNPERLLLRYLQNENVQIQRSELNVDIYN